MFLLLELMLSVSEGAGVAVGARLVCHPLLAKLSFDLDFVIFRKNSAVTLEGELIVRGS